MSAPIRCEGLTRWYGEVQGIASLTCAIGPGVVGLLGPNGSGKTTLMRLLTGQIRPQRGFVELFGERIGPDSYKLFHRVGHTPGDDIHFEQERARDFLALMATLGGQSGDDPHGIAEQALDRVGMADTAHKRLCEMSKGMRQRVKLAQAILFEPELLLLDEPLNGMDPVSRRKTIDLVREWGDSGRTVLFASHILHEVEAVTSSVVMLHHGRLLAEGRLHEIRDLVSHVPRQVRLITSDPQRVAQELLAADRISGLDFGHGGLLKLETRNLDALLDALDGMGRDQLVDSLEIADESLEAVFDLLVEGTPR